MIVSIQNNTKEIKVTSIILAADHDSDNFNALFCPRCQFTLGQYNGYVFSITPGFSPVPMPFYFKCKNCKWLYSVQGIV